MRHWRLYASRTWLGRSWIVAKRCATLLAFRNAFSNGKGNRKALIKGKRKKLSRKRYKTKSETATVKTVSFRTGTVQTFKELSRVAVFVVSSVNTVNHRLTGNFQAIQLVLGNRCQVQDGRDEEQNVDEPVISPIAEVEVAWLWLNAFANGNFKALSS